MYTIDFASGVYLREDDRSGRVTGVTTSIVAAVFAANRGPVNKVRPVSDGDERALVYGNSDPQLSLATYSLDEALKATNRGYAVRVAVGALYGGVVVSKRASNKKLAPTTVTATASTGTGTLTNGTYSYRVVAKDEAGKTLPSLAATATVLTSAVAASLTTTLTGNNNDLVFTAKTAGIVGNSNSITYTDPGANNQLLSVTVTPGAGFCTVAVSLATDGTGAIITTANDIFLALSANTTFATYMSIAFAPSNTGAGIVTALPVTNLTGGAATGANDGLVTVNWTAVTGALAYEVYGRTAGTELLMYTTPNATTLSWVDTGAVTPSGAQPVSNTTSDIAITPFATGLADPATELVFSSGDMFAVYGDNPGTWNNAELRVAIEKVDTTDGTFDVALYRPGQVVAFERWTVSRTKQLDGFGRQLFLEERINPLSTQIKVLNNASDTQVVNVNYTTPTAMAGGSNGTAPTLTDIAAAWSLFADPEEVPVRILINGGYADPIVQVAMNEIAATRKDCVAILDIPSDQQDYIAAVNYRNNTLNLDSNYAAIYTCDQKYVDRNNDLTLFVPPSGFVARAMARTDRLFASYWAAAGMERGDVASLGSRYRYNQGQRNYLAENQVNYIRTFVGIGFKIWEQFTCTKKKSALQFLNVRMLVILVQASVQEFLLYNVFDPNDAITRRRIVGRISQFLDLLVAGRGINKYQVVCDDSNNKPADIDDGLLNVDIYMNPVIPARRILLTAIITPTGADFKETVVSQSEGV